MGKNTANQKRRGGLLAIVETRTFLPPAIVMLLLIIAGLIMPEKFGDAAQSAKNFVAVHFGWWYAIVMILLTVFNLWLVLNPKIGDIRFGGKDAKPEYSTFTWAAITLTSGTAIGILFYSVAEPLTYFESPPPFSGIAGGTAEAAENALKYAYFHWLMPYMIYGAIAVCIGFMVWNCGKRYKISSSLYTLLGSRCDGNLGSWLDGICLFATVSGITTSFGLGVLQIGTGIRYVFGVQFNETLFNIFLIAGYTALFIFSACSGMKKAISLICDIDSYLYMMLLALVLVCGGAVFILNNTVTSIGKVFATMIPQLFYLEPAYQSGWVADNTMFFWAWALAGTPVVSLFMIKMAKGRTIREFIAVNVVIPMAFVMAWFGFLGSAGLRFAMNGEEILEAMHEFGTAAAMFALFKGLPMCPVLLALVFLALIFSVVTLFQSMTLTLADMTSVKVRRGEEAQSPIGLRIFWGVLMGLMAYVLLLSGGLQTIQTISIIFALPFTLLLLLMLAGFIKAVQNREHYETAAR